MKNLLLLLLVFTAGCESIAYYSQAIRGQLGLMSAARPVDAWLADPATPQELRGRLQSAQRIRDFASQRLALPQNGSYSSYADLGRPYVVWNVYAAPRFAVEAKQECFPFTGCVSYRGFFSEEEARKQAARLRSEGYDVYLGGVPAYSTLGWFDDPLLSTFIQYPDVQLARLVFHELAHQRVYAKNDTTFNESFATAVERLGGERWLRTQADEKARQDYAAYDGRRRLFRELSRSTRERLKELYETPGMAPDAKEEAKRKAMEQFRVEYAQMKERAGGDATVWRGYDRWVREANNAFFGAQAAYDELVPGFEALFEREGEDWPRFYAAVKRLAEMPKAERRQALRTQAAPATAGAPATQQQGGQGG